MKHFGSQLLVVALLLPASAQLARADSLGGIVAQARKEGLPASALENKIKEGRAKGVPAARIAMVVKRLAGFMRSAKGWLSKPATAGGKTRRVPSRLIVSVAEARLAGVERKAVKSLLSGKRFPRAASRRVDSLADLKLRGYSAQRSVELLRSSRPADLAGIGQAADRMRRSTGLSRGKVLQRMTTQVRKTGRLRSVDGRAGPGRGPPPGGPPGASGGSPHRPPPPPPPPSRFRK